MSRESVDGQNPKPNDVAASTPTVKKTEKKGKLVIWNIMTAVKATECESILAADKSWPNFNWYF